MRQERGHTVDRQVFNPYVLARVYQCRYSPSIEVLNGVTTFCHTRGSAMCNFNLKKDIAISYQELEALASVSNNIAM